MNDVEGTICGAGAVVFVGNGGAEHSQEAITQQLVDDAATACDGLCRLGKEGVEVVHYLLGLGLFDERREPARV